MFSFRQLQLDPVQLLDNMLMVEVYPVLTSPAIGSSIHGKLPAPAMSNQGASASATSVGLAGRRSRSL